MVLEWGAAFALEAGVISELSIAAVMMTVRWLDNGVERVEHCAVVLAGEAEAVSVLADSAPLPDPLPANLIDCAQVALGEAVSLSAGSVRALSDDLSEYVLW